MPDGAVMTKAEWEAMRLEAMDAIPDVIAQVGQTKALLPYQQGVVGLLNSVGTQVLFVEKSRRIGLTWGLAAYAVHRAGRQKGAGGMDVMYISYSKEMTREFVDACAMWARAFSSAAMAEEECLFEEGDHEGDKAIQAFRIRFASGFEIMALSSAPRGLRGKQGVVIIDEAAFVDNLDTLIEAAMAFLMWGGQVVVCSTHFGVDNTFNTNIQDILAERKPGHHVRIDLDQAITDGLYERICLIKGLEWSVEAEASWRQDIINFYGDSADQELFCVPSLSTGSWLAAPLIEARMTIDKPVITLDLPKDYLQRSKLDQNILMAPFYEQIEEELGKLDMDLRYALGFDFARVADLSVLPVLAIEPNMNRTEVLCLEMRGVPGDEQKKAVGMVMGHLRTRLVGAAFDATGMGWTVAEDMGRKFGLRETEDGSGLVWAIKFTEDWYRINMPPLKSAFEDGSLQLIKSDDHTSDLRVVKLLRGIPRVPTVREGETGKKRHGDFAIGLALAHFATRMRWSEYGYRPVPHRTAPHQSNNQSANHSDGRLNMRPNHDDDRRQRGQFDGPLGARIRGGI